MAIKNRQFVPIAFFLLAGLIVIGAFVFNRQSAHVSTSDTGQDLNAQEVTSLEASDRQKPSTSPLDAIQIQGISQSDLEYAEKIAELPPHQWHLERRHTLQAQSMSEVAKALDDIQDRSMAETSLGGGLIPGYFSGEAQRLIVIRLFRVRKLLSANSAEREVVVPLLIENLESASASWQSVFHEMKFADQRTKAMQTAVNQLRMPAAASAYVLGEYGAPEALPAVFAHFEAVANPDVNSPHYNPQFPPSWASPVAASQSMYATHRIITSWPLERLTQEQRGLRSAYLEVAKELPPVEIKPVTAWDGFYSESDPQVVTLDPNRIVLTGERKVDIAIYPFEYGEHGDPLVDDLGFLSPLAKRVYAAMVPFVESVRD